MCIKIYKKKTIWNFKVRMLDYQDEEFNSVERVKTDKEYVSPSVLDWGKFAIMLVFGLILISVSIPFTSVLIVNPKPFTLLFSLGSLIILFSLLHITQPYTIIQKSGSLVIVIIYFISLCLGLYSGLFSMGYFKTMAIMAVQVQTYILYILSIYSYTPLHR